MSEALVAKGKTAIRASLKATFTHVGITTDDTPWAENQDRIDPAEDPSDVTLIKEATLLDVPGTYSFDDFIEIDGDTEFTGSVIKCISLMTGPLPTDVASRSIRDEGLGLGVQAGDLFSIGPRVSQTDIS